MIGTLTSYGPINGMGNIAGISFIYPLYLHSVYEDSQGHHGYGLTMLVTSCCCLFSVRGFIFPDEVSDLVSGREMTTVK